MKNKQSTKPVTVEECTSWYERFKKCQKELQGLFSELGDIEDRLPMQQKCKRLAGRIRQNDLKFVHEVWIAGNDWSRFINAVKSKEVYPEQDAGGDYGRIEPRI